MPADVQADLNVYNNIQANVTNSQVSYEQMESIAIRSGTPPPDNGMNVVAYGAWYNPGKGYYMRVMPDNFMETRVQIYVPVESGDPEFNPTDDIGVPADTDAQRLGFGCAGTGDGGYSDGTTSVSDVAEKDLDKYSADGPHCSEYVADVISDLKITDDLKGLNAKQQLDYISNSSDWSKANSASEAQNFANAGYLVLGMTQDSSGNGHVVIVAGDNDLYNSHGGVPFVYDVNVYDGYSNSIYNESSSPASGSWTYKDDNNTPQWFYYNDQTFNP